jgi:hypothetical protein
MIVAVALVAQGRQAVVVQVVRTAPTQAVRITPIQVRQAVVPPAVGVEDVVEVATRELPV